MRSWKDLWWGKEVQIGVQWFTIAHFGKKKKKKVHFLKEPLPLEWSVEAICWDECKCIHEWNKNSDMRQIFYYSDALLLGEAVWGALTDLRTAGETQVTWDWAFPPNSWKNKPAGLSHLRSQCIWSQIHGYLLLPQPWPTQSLSVVNEKLHQTTAL